IDQHAPRPDTDRALVAIEQPIERPRDQRLRQAGGHLDVGAGHVAVVPPDGLEDGALRLGVVDAAKRRGHARSYTLRAPAARAADPAAFSSHGAATGGRTC